MRDDSCEHACRMLVANQANDQSPWDVARKVGQNLPRPHAEEALQHIDGQLQALRYVHLEFIIRRIRRGEGDSVCNHCLDRGTCHPHILH